MHATVAGHKCWQVPGWSGLLASALLLASLFQAVAIAATGGAVKAEPTSNLSPATRGPANRDGGDVRASRTWADPSTTCFCRPRFLASVSDPDSGPIQLDHSIESCDA